MVPRGPDTNAIRVTTVVGPVCSVTSPSGSTKLQAPACHARTIRRIKNALYT